MSAMSPFEMKDRVEVHFVKLRLLEALHGIALNFNRNGSILISKARRIGNNHERGWGTGRSNGGVRFQDMDCGDWCPVIEFKRETDQETFETVVQKILEIHEEKERLSCCEDAKGKTESSGFKEDCR